MSTKMAVRCLLPQVLELFAMPHVPEFTTRILLHLLKIVMTSNLLSSLPVHAVEEFLMRNCGFAHISHNPRQLCVRNDLQILVRGYPGL